MEATIRVYRLETEISCHGVFMCQAASYIQDSGSGADPYGMPTPSDDFPNIPMGVFSVFRFGFSSLDQYFTVFCTLKSRELLRGYRDAQGEAVVMRVYLVPDNPEYYHHSAAQAMYDTNHAERLETFEPPLTKARSLER